MISSSLWLLLLLAAVSRVHCVELTQTDSVVLSPGQVLTLSCKLYGYSVTDSSYWTHWIRQPAGKALEWVGDIGSSGDTYYSDKLKSRFQIGRDISSNTVTLRGQNMQTEDTSVYYCARERAHSDTKHKQFWSKTS
ncbi:hypothetical protein cypCar_00046012 [Cyprinus carpio]|nr:hypothetical protein cypCar_00046012 [Cyprinus carpio]